MAVNTFTFANDKLGGSSPTSTIDSSGAVQTEVSVNGAQTVSFASGVKMKKFLHAVQVKGMRVGGDIEITDGGELFLSDGTAASSLIKEVDLVFGIVTGTGPYTFEFKDPSLKWIEDLQVDSEDPQNLTEALGTVGGDSDYGALNLEAADPQINVDGTAALAKWYLRLVRPNGEVEYKLFRPINDLMDGLAGVGNDGAIFSILGAMREINDLQGAIRTVIAAAQLASQNDVDALELKVDRDIESLASFLGDLESHLQSYMEDGDDAVRNYLSSRMTELQTSFNNIHDAVRLHGVATEIDIDQLNSGIGSNEVTFKSGDALNLSVLTSADDISKWMIDVGIVQTHQLVGESFEALVPEVRRNDIDTSWVASFVEEGEPVQKKLQIVASLETIGDDLQGKFDMVVNAVYCGAQPALNANASNASYLPPTYSDMNLTLNTDGGTPDSDSDATGGGRKVRNVTLTFNMNGEDGVAPQSQLRVSGAYYGTLPTITAAEGFEFLGWSLTVDGAVLSSTSIVGDANVTLYAIVAEQEQV